MAKLTGWEFSSPENAGSSGQQVRGLQVKLLPAELASAQVLLSTGRGFTQMSISISARANRKCADSFAGCAKVMSSGSAKHLLYKFR